MNFKKIVYFPVCFFLSILFIPSVYSGEPESSTEVLVTKKDSSIFAFSGPQNHWVSEGLFLNEKIRKKKNKGNIAVVITDKRILAFSVFTDKWEEKSLNLSEKLSELQIEDNLAIIVTTHRTFAFNGHTGKFVEAK